MKVLQLISSSGFFGAENVLVQLAEALSRQDGITVVAGVIENSRNPHLEVAEESRKQGIEAVVFPCDGRFDQDQTTVRSSRRCIRGKRIDVIHSHGYKSNIFAALVSLNLPVALVSTCHNWLGDHPKMRLYAVLDRFFLPRFPWLWKRKFWQAACRNPGYPTSETVLTWRGLATRTRPPGSGPGLEFCRIT